MSQQINIQWKIKFPLTSDQEARLSEWQRNHPQSSAIHGALQFGFVDEADYLEWAAQVYQLPFLKPQFLEHPARSDLLQVFSSGYGWSNERIPIGLWDDTLYVICLEPVVNNYSLVTQWVLATTHILNQVWKAMGQPEPVYEFTLPSPDTS